MMRRVNRRNLAELAVVLVLGSGVYWRFFRTVPTPSEVQTAPLRVESVPLPSAATCEVGVGTAALEEEIAQLLQRDTLRALLTSAPCTTQCAKMTALLSDPQRVIFEVMTAERWVIPPRERLGLGQNLLTPEQTERLYTLPRVVAIRTVDPDPRANLAGALCFQLSSILARELRGFVLDETVDRIYDARTAEAFARDRDAQVSVVVALEEQRIITRGMRRFGMPDLLLANVPRTLASPLAQIVRQIAPSTHGPLPLRVRGRDVFRYEVAEPAEGLPDNLVLVLQPQIGFEELASLAIAGESKEDVARAIAHVARAWPRLEQEHARGKSVSLRIETISDAGREEAVWVPFAARHKFDKVSGYQFVTEDAGLETFPDVNDSPRSQGTL
jgi:hypothetical protein